MMTTAFTVELLAALGEHLAAFDLPAIASVHIACRKAGPQATVQLAQHGQLPAIAAGLLAWPTPSPTSALKPGASHAVTPA